MTDHFKINQKSYPNIAFRSYIKYLIHQVVRQSSGSSKSKGAKTGNVRGPTRVAYQLPGEDAGRQRLYQAM
jgi:hypothetical protein